MRKKQKTTTKTKKNILVFILYFATSGETIQMLQIACVMHYLMFIMPFEAMKHGHFAFKSCFPTSLFFNKCICSFWAFAIFIMSFRCLYASRECRLDLLILVLEKACSCRYIVPNTRRILEAKAVILGNVGSRCQ